jgi:hypothetical protein
MVVAAEEVVANIVDAGYLPRGGSLVASCSSSRSFLCVQQQRRDLDGGVVCWPAQRLPVAWEPIEVGVGLVP